MSQLRDDDYLLVNRSGISYKVLGSDVKSSIGPDGISPTNSDISFSPSVSGSGTQEDPYILTTVQCSPSGGNISSTEDITISNQTPDTFVVFKNINGGVRFNQPYDMIENDGTWTGKLKYTDSPTTSSQTNYTADFQIGSVYIRWTVTQLTPPNLIQSSATTISGTEQVGYTLTAIQGTATGGTGEITYSTIWQYSEDGTSGWSNISGATLNTYTITSSYGNKYIRAVTIATDSYSIPVTLEIPSVSTGQINSGVAPNLDTALLYEGNPTGSRFRSNKFVVDISTLESGNPVAQKQIKATLSGSLYYIPLTSDIVSVQSQSAIVATNRIDYNLDNASVNFGNGYAGAYAINEDVVFTSNFNTLFTSTNRGSSWTQTTGPTTFYGYFHLWKGRLLSFSVSGGATLQVSTDNGSTWTSTGLEAVTPNIYTGPNGTTIVLANNNNTLYSTNSGSSWISIGTSALKDALVWNKFLVYFKGNTYTFNGGSIRKISGNNIITSTYTDHTTLPPHGGGSFQYAAANSNVMVVAVNGADQTNTAAGGSNKIKLWRSTNAVDWFSFELDIWYSDPNNFPRLFTMGDRICIITGSGAPAGRRCVLAHSSDGVNWTYEFMPYDSVILYPLNGEFNASTWVISGSVPDESGNPHYGFISFSTKNPDKLILQDASNLDNFFPGSKIIEGGDSNIDAVGGVLSYDISEPSVTVLTQTGNWNAGNFGYGQRTYQGQSAVQANLTLDSNLNVTAISDEDLYQNIPDNGSQAIISCPDSLTTTNLDNDIPSGTTLTVSVKASNAEGQDVITSNTITPGGITNGTSYLGGYFMGIYTDDNSVQWQIILSPKENENSSVAYKTTNTADGGTSSSSTYWGQPPTTDFNNTDHPLFQWASSQNGIGGFNDWYVPSIYELQIVYNQRNSLPVGQTLETTSKYWSANETAVGPTTALSFDFSTNSQSSINKTTATYARLIRRVRVY